MRLCGFRSRISMLRYAAAGQLRIRDDADGHWVHIPTLVQARTLLIGRFAHLTGLTAPRVRKALRKGLIPKPEPPWPGANRRFRLADVVPARERLRALGIGIERLNDAGERRLKWLRKHGAG